MAATADIIRRKRDGGELTAEEIRSLVGGIARDAVSQAQVGAFLMAVFLRGMNAAEQAALTLAMRDSGAVLEWRGLDGPVLDKHSTGGVGDLVSLVLAPMVAACGGYVPMISGRGLGHTGGTLDKLEAIPGLDVNPEPERARRVVREVGFVMMGQSADLAPADRRMYAVRDVTATVSCMPLIVSSILSKKLAEGLDALVMDIKTGNGAFMVELEASRKLASAIIEVSVKAGLPCRAVISDMNQPLARSAGNGLEVREAIAFLDGSERGARLTGVVMALAGELLQMGGLAPDPETARAALQDALDSGAAAERFARMVRVQGGPSDLLEHPGRYLSDAPVVRAVVADADGYIAAIDTRAVGACVVELGGGRSRLEDTIDPRVGISDLCSLGQEIRRGQPLARVHADSQVGWEQAAASLAAAIRIDPGPVTPPPVLYALQAPAP